MAETSSPVSNFESVTFVGACLATLNASTIPVDRSKDLKPRTAGAETILALSADVPTTRSRVRCYPVLCLFFFHRQGARYRGSSIMYLSPRVIAALPAQRPQLPGNRPRRCGDVCESVSSLASYTGLLRQVNPLRYRPFFHETTLIMTA